jgi:hypothetical protein
MQAAGMVIGPVAENWKRRFDDTIETPEGGKIKTLDDARHYLATFGLPKAGHKRLMLANALRAVLGAANGTDLMMHARIAVGRWVHRDAPPKEMERPRKRAKAYRIVK